jgi:hypothetical protein
MLNRGYGQKSVQKAVDPPGNRQKMIGPRQNLLAECSDQNLISKHIGGFVMLTAPAQNGGQRTVGGKLSAWSAVFRDNPLFRPRPADSAPAPHQRQKTHNR